MVELTGRPVYLRIADDLRRRILDGSLPAGEKLPSIAELVADYETSTTTVRQAINVLRNEGLVFGHQGKGSFVRPARVRRRRVVNHLYKERPSSSPLGKAIASEGARPAWDHHSQPAHATRAVADRLSIEPGEPVMVTQYRFFADDEPVMLSTSYEPLELTGGTPIEQPEVGSITGVVPRFDSIGIRITHVQEDVTARAARPYEVEALHVPVGIPVMAVERTYFASDQPVETADIVVAADTYTLSYVVPIPDR